MVINIFVLNWNKEKHTSKTQIAYPNEGEFNNSKKVIRYIFDNCKGLLEDFSQEELYNRAFLTDEIKVLNLDEFRYIFVPLPGNQILGLIFQNEDRPEKYKNKLIDFLLDYFIEKYIAAKDESTRQNYLLTLFVDLRQYTNSISTIVEENFQLMRRGDEILIKLFVFGIDNAGKTSLIRLLKMGEFEQDFFRPTRRFRMTNIELEKNVKIVCWDMPGQVAFREDWLHGAHSSNIILFVLDINDCTRYEEAAASFWRMLNLHTLKNLTLIFLINKTDLLEEETNEEEIVQIFDLHTITDRNYFILQSSLPEKVGIDELLTLIKKESYKLLRYNNVEVEESA